MSFDEGMVFAVLAAVLVGFVTGRVRYDIVAVLALLALAATGVVPAADAFDGFGNPAVITVAAVLVISRGFSNAGLVEALAGFLGRTGSRPFVQVLALSSVAMAASAFMNNVAALAILLPVAVKLAQRTGTRISQLLMPLSFASLLGGMLTLIGTPPNIIVADYRRQATGAAFEMFDFTKVAIVLAPAALLLLALGSRYLIPQRTGRADTAALFEIDQYVAEATVGEQAKLTGKTVSDLEEASEGVVSVVGIAREERQTFVPTLYDILRPGDVVMLKGSPEAMTALAAAQGLKLVDKQTQQKERAAVKEQQGVAAAPGDEAHTTHEVVVTPSSRLAGWSARTLGLRRQYGITVLAVARQGYRFKERIATAPFMAGDILLVSGPTVNVGETFSTLGLLPLAGRELGFGRPRRLLLSAVIFGTAIGLAVSGVLSIQITLVGAAVGMTLAGLIPVRELYNSIEWPVIVLLGAMIPVGVALESAGGTARISGWMVTLTEGAHPAVAVAVVLVVAMFLSDIVNNAAAAVVMAPIAIAVAAGLGISPDPLLIAIAIGASCAFLTPIGHQANTLVLGPGGYRFGDYWRLGLPLEILVVAIAVPMILLVWPP